MVIQWRTMSYEYRKRRAKLGILSSTVKISFYLQ